MHRFILALGLTVIAAQAGAQARPLPAECCIDARCSGPDIVECSSDNPAGCTNAVVITKDGPSCSAVLPYRLLCVRRQVAGPALLMTWTLTTTDHTNSYYFSSIGINIVNPSIGSKEYFIAPRLAWPNRDKFTWTTGPDATVAPHLSHSARVFPKGNPQDCTVAPAAIIVNTDK